MLNILSITGFFQTVGAIVVALLVLLATITVHEFGHYVVGKIFKFKINEFSIGMGPRLYKKVLKSGEIFSIRLLPLGGFCAFEGEDQESTKDKKSADKTDNTPFEDFKDDESNDLKQGEKIPNEQKREAFNDKKPYQRILVLVAGATMNFVFAMLIIFFNFACYGHFVLQANEVVSPRYSGQQSQYVLQDGDKLLAVENTYLYLTTDVSKSLMGKSKGDLVSVTVVDKNGQKVVRQVELCCDTDSTDKYSYIQAFEALGIATVTRLETAEGSPFENGSYLLKINDGVDYQHCSRIYDHKEFMKIFADKKSGDTVQIWVNESGSLNSEQTALITITLDDKWDEVDKTDLSKVKQYFKISSFNMFYDVDSVNVKLSFVELLYRPFVYSFKNVGATFEAIGDMFGGSMGIENLSGPIATVAMTSQYVKNGFNYVLEIAGLIGISIGIFNLLPIPALDGARVVFVIIEWIRKKPIDRKIEALIHTIGLFALLGFAVLVDVLKLFI